MDDRTLLSELLHNLMRLTDKHAYPAEQRFNNVQMADDGSATAKLIMRDGTIAELTLKRMEL